MNNLLILRCFNISRTVTLKCGRIPCIARPLTCLSRCQVSCLHSWRMPMSSQLRNFNKGKQFVRFCSSKPDETKSAMRTRLLYATYFSMAIGGCLVTAIVLRELGEARLRTRGIERIKDDLQTGRPQMIRYKDTMLPIFVEKIIDEVENFETDESDVWVVSFPRSGTTLTQEMVDLVNSEGNFIRTQLYSLEDRFPYFEYVYPGIKDIKEKKPPRLIKSHLPLRLLPRSVREGKAKIIYIARNPKDTCVSYFHFVQLLKPMFRFNGNFDDFFDRFIHDKVPYGPWWRHVKEFWEIKDSPKVLFLYYEDIVEDLAGTVVTIAEFLGKKLHPMEINLIADHCSFDNMKKNHRVNYSWWKELGIADKSGQDFIRKGKVGDWRDVFDEKKNLRVETMKHLKLNETGIKFNEG